MYEEGSLSVGAGRRPGVAKESFDPDLVFYCRARRRKMRFATCLGDYLDANAFGSRGRLCWRCPEGRQYRERFAKS